MYLAATVTDLRSRTIPNALPLTLLAAGGLRCLVRRESILPPVLSGAAVLLLLLAAALIGDAYLSRKGRANCCLGGGDIKLLAATAFALGSFPALIILLFSQLGLLVVLLWQKLQGKPPARAVPLAPFLLFGLICFWLLF